ncbi:TPA: oligoribonuclease [Pseudomonas aeruginosa]
MMNNDRRLAWLDLESTGFTELHKQMVYLHRILEVGLLVTDAQFNVLAQHVVVIHHDPADIFPLCDDIVRSMHTRNGLFDDVSASSTDLASAEQQIIEFLVEHGVQAKASPLCGSGIHFDRMFLEAQMPALNAHLHYRNLDISAVKEFLKTISPAFEPVKRQSHRALDDILESVEEARLYRDLLTPILAA